MTIWVRLEYGLYLEKCLRSRSERKSWWQIMEGLEYQAEEFGVLQALGRNSFSAEERISWSCLMSCWVLKGEKNRADLQKGQ